MDFVNALVPPALLAAVVIFMMRDLKADMRAMRAELLQRLDKLSDDHNNLSRELSELRGAVNARNVGTARDAS